MFGRVKVVRANTFTKRFVVLVLVDGETDWSERCRGSYAKCNRVRREYLKLGYKPCGRLLTA